MTIHEMAKSVNQTSYKTSILAMSLRLMSFNFGFRAHFRVVRVEKLIVLGHLNQLLLLCSPRLLVL
jgi:hypothetical protein